MDKSGKEETTCQASLWAQLVMPLAALMRGELLSLVQELGLQAFAVMLEAERTEVCGPRYKHDRARRAYRAGSTRGELALGGRRVTLRRKRVVDRDGCEVMLDAWKRLSAEDPLNARALEQMTVGVATRKYARSLEPLPDSIEERGTSKSAISRRFIAMTAAKLTAWMARPLHELDLRALFIDGIYFGEHLVLCVLGVDTAGHKHVLGLWEGATENEVACKAMLDNLIERGLDPKPARLWVIDGAKGLRKAIRCLFGRRALVQRCQVHKIRNVEGHLPKSKQARVRVAMRQAYKAAKVETAKRLLLQLARSLEPQYSSAAGSLREGLDETLTVMGLGLSHALVRSLSTTNPIENLNERIRTTARRVKRWREGTMVLRWVAVGVLEAERGFRRLKGYKDMSALIARLKHHERALDTGTVDPREEAA